MNKEIWKVYKRIPNRFYISTKGRVKSFSLGKIIKTSTDKYGYERMAIIVGSRTDKTRKTINLKVHQMVAETFLGLPTINHKDNNKLNNNVENLEWCSAGENVSKGWKDGLFKNIFSKETRQKISDAHKGRKQSEEWVKKRILSGLRTKKNRIYGI